MSRSLGLEVENESRMSVVAAETESSRFAFGRNWSEYLRVLTPDRITAAEQSLTAVFGHDGLRGKRFLDIGSGSGLFSLAAHRLGAKVFSFDFDPDSVACTESLKQQSQTDVSSWHVERGSVLDGEYLESLGTFDIVYSWGVLHHTGAMWEAIERAAARVALGGQLWIALYNDQGAWSRVWTAVKQWYNQAPRWLQPLIVWLVGIPWMASRGVSKVTAILLEALFRLLSGQNPFTGGPRRSSAFASQKARGMHWYYDLVDWIGGFPFEVAKPGEVLDFLHARGFVLDRLTTCGGNLGCNEFVFRKLDAA